MKQTQDLFCCSSCALFQLNFSVSSLLCPLLLPRHAVHMMNIELVLGGIPVFLVWYGIKFRLVLLYKDFV